MDAERFRDRVAIVVGAAQGIGLVAAEQFVREGASVVMSDVNPGVLAEAEKLNERVGDNGAAAVGQVCDIVDPAACEALAATAEERFGRIDVLAVIAGVVQDARPVEQLEPEEWDRIMAINAKGPFLMSRAVVPRMRRNEAGRIVTIASFYGESGHPFFAAYCASKGAVRLFTQVLAAEVAEHNITANAVAPGNINTAMHQKALQDEADARGVSKQEIQDVEWGKIPLKVAGDPADIADAVLFLASDQAKYITGACLDVNGGVLFR
ncbi:MAG TPA: SDR family NAD(P)-dependent oxidoreductase [Solirubrobacterales bacterium]|nr:SDR family NAD(P)-dependent oxidoreductase [Solirubrobacterales bacterium]